MGIKVSPTGKITEEILLFLSSDLDKVLKEVNWRIDKDGRIIGESGEPVPCSVCNKPLYKENLGTLYPGSHKAVCDDFACFLAASFYKEAEKETR